MKNLDSHKVGALFSAMTGTRICVVERNVLAREFLVLYFENLGFRTLSCASAFDFFKTHENTHVKAPHLILLDSLLPDLTCPEFMERLRSGTDLRRCAVLLTSPNASSAQVQAGLQAGAQDVVEKPLNTMQLGTKIAHWLTRLQLSLLFLCAVGFGMISQAKAQSFRLEESLQLEQQIDPQLQGRVSQTFFRYTQKDAYFLELQLRYQRKYNFSEFLYGPRLNYSLTPTHHLECAFNVGPGAHLFPRRQYECLVDAALSTGTVFTLLANVSQYETGTARLVRPMVEQYWLEFRSAYALFISSLPGQQATFSHQFVQSWYPNDFNKLEASYAFGHTEGKTLHEATLLGEWAFVPSWWLLATAGSRLFGSYKTNTFSLGLRHEF